MPAHQEHHRRHPHSTPLPPPPHRSYECPLDALTTFYRPPARLMLAIDNMSTNGAQLSQAGCVRPPGAHGTCAARSCWLGSCARAGGVRHAALPDGSALVDYCQLPQHPPSIVHLPL